MKTIVLSAVLIFASFSASAQPLYQTFAICTGRLMAALEHSWLMQADTAEVRQFQRQQFESLLEVTAPKGEARTILTLRVEARASHNMILQRASFGQSEREKAWASRQAHSALMQCLRLLPST